MKLWKRMATVFLIGGLAGGLTPSSVSAAETPKVQAQAAILMDYETGRVLWSKNADAPMAMASTTKIMTAITALEEGDLESVVTVSARAASAPKVKMYLQTGEQHTLGNLLYPLMLESSNDAAIAIAEHLGGDVETFCAHMTERAKELGAKDTVFETPNGLDSGDHHSTAYDMAVIARHALQNEQFRAVIATPSKTITDLTGKRTYTFNNKNRLLWEVDGAIGVKTGFTGKAGHCFVGAVERDGRTLISVVLASGWGTAGKAQKWSDTKQIISYGFAAFSPVEVLTAETAAEPVSVTRARETEVGTKLAESLTLPLTEEEKGEVTVRYHLPESLEAPLTAGQTIGKAEALLNGEVLGEVPIVLTADIARHDFETSLRKIIEYWLHMNGADLLRE